MKLGWKFLLGIVVACGASAAAPHVVVIGLDGLSPDGVSHANAPTFRRLMQTGAWTLHARGVMPTSSSPNWASMIMGAGPEQHGVTSNEWETNKFDIPPIAVGSGGMFPTIFGVLREQKPSITECVFHDWDGFGRLFERSAVDFIEDSEGPTNAVRHAVQYWKEHKPNFTFIHMDHVDHAGHHFGHGTAEYYASVDVADALIAEVLDGLKSAGMADAYVLITADHGGVGTKHGGATMAELEIPWILVGPRARKGFELKQPVSTCDTAATLAHLFRVRAPRAWIGKPVLEALR